MLVLVLGLLVVIVALCVGGLVAIEKSRSRDEELRRDEAERLRRQLQAYEDVDALIASAAKSVRGIQR